MNVTLLTSIPSPYQLELWDAIAQNGVMSPRVVFVDRTHSDRHWLVQIPSFEHVFLEDGPKATATALDWVQTTDLFIASWYASSLARKLIDERLATGKPWVYWGERPGFSRLGVLGRVWRWSRLSALRRSNAPVWGIGSWAVDAWQREFGIRRPYQNLPYYSDLARFAPHTDQRNVGDSGIRFLYSGSLTERKGVDILASAFTQIAATRPNIQLAVVGAGEMEPTLRAKLRGLGNRVTFFGFVSWADLPAVYHRADVLVAPSRYDGWGLIVPEGLAAGLPVIGTDRTGAALDLIEPGINGWRVRAGDEVSLTLAMAEAADLTAAKLRTMSASARESVSLHNLDVGVRRFVAAANAAIEGWSGDKNPAHFTSRSI